MTDPKTVGWLKRHLEKASDEQPVFLECNGVLEPLQLATNGTGITLHNGDLETKIREVAKTKGNLAAVKYYKDMTDKPLPECVEAVNSLGPSFNG